MSETDTFEITDRDTIYVNGEWIDPGAATTLDVIDSTTEAVIGRIPECSAENAAAAVDAARAAFAGWAETDPAERARYLRAIADGLAERTEEVGALIAHEVGMPLPLSVAIQAGMPPRTFAAAADVLDGFKWSEEVDGCEVVREPIGVVVAITPWNYPLHQIALKVAPALAAGCTVVVKPSEVAPLNAFVLAEVIDKAGLPAGVFNLVAGTGPVVGEALAAHPEVDMVSFTGSTRAGRRVSELAAQSIKRVTLELGGKSANVLLDDLDRETFETAVASGVRSAFLNSGQTCSAHTRMLVPRELAADAEDVAAQAADSLRPGDPFGDGKLGPLVSGTQQARVREYIKSGIDDGARLVTGGADSVEGLESGYFVAPTVFGGVTPDMQIAREEIFGPVLSIMPYDSVDEAIEIANDTIYGLSGGVWSSDPQRARKVARRLRTGEVSINGAGYNPKTPFGGFKQSGNGREAGRFGFEEYLEYKTLLQ